MKKLDTRVQYSKQAFHKALLSILRKKPIGDVTVTELCTAAGLNRGTFYRNYSNPYDVLMEIESEFMDAHFSLLNSYMDNKYNSVNLAKLLTCIFQNADVCKILLGKNGSPRFVERLRNLAHDSVLADWHRAFPTYERRDLEFAYDYIFYASTHMIMDYISGEPQMTFLEFANLLDSFCYASLLSIKSFRHEQGK